VIFIILSPRLVAEAELSPEAIDKTSDALPSWVIGSSFVMSHQLSLKLDGTEASSMILRESQSSDRIVWKDAQNHRVFRQLPFSQSSKEVLHIGNANYIMTPSNRRVSIDRDVSQGLWLEVMLFPFELSKKWGLVDNDLDWNEWFEKLKSVKAPLVSNEGDKIRVEYSKGAKDEQKLQLILEGHLLHDGRTSYKIVSDWIIEFKKVSDKDLEKSLLGGGAG